MYGSDYVSANFAPADRTSGSATGSWRSSTRRVAEAVHRFVRGWFAYLTTTDRLFVKRFPYIGRMYNDIVAENRIDLVLRRPVVRAGTDRSRGAPCAGRIGLVHRRMLDPSVQVPERRDALDLARSPTWSNAKHHRTLMRRLDGPDAT